MSTVNSTASTTNAADEITGTTGSAVERKTGGNLGKDDFLKLMVAQMSHMDPLAEGGSDPSKSMDTMTQFSILEQLTNLSKSTEASTALATSQSAVALIGKSVTYPNLDGEPVTGVVESVQTAGGKSTLTVAGVAGISPADVLEVK